jgi:hypothetical protein
VSRGLSILALLGSAALALGSGLAPGPGHARGDAPPEAPPPPGTRLTFEKTLFVQRTPDGRVFAETRRVEPGENLHRILTREYQIPEEALPALVRAFRAANPGVDPDRLAAGQVVRVPFKVEEGIAAPAPPAAAAAPPTYTVQPGDNLWRILRDRLGVPRERMQEALAAVARANPGIRDLNRLHVGQQLTLPPLPGTGLGAGSAVEAAGAPVPPSYRTALELLRELRCQVAEEGETFVPLSRGRTLRLEGRDFPVVSGPAGGKVILDPGRRLSAALVRALREEWGYACVAGVDPDPEAYLGAILPRLGFFELSEGERSIPLGRGTELLALARWTVVPRPQDLWEGSVHLLFSPGSLLDPRLVLAARRAGYAVHPLGPAVLGAGSEPPGSSPAPAALAELPMADPAQGASRLLSLLGVSHRVRPEVECDLGGGVRYRLTPLLTLRFGGLDYAVPPAEPARAEAVLTRAGYFTIPWPPGVAPLNILGDLLALLGVPHSRPTLEAPAGEALRLRLSGIVLQEPGLAELLYPDRAGSQAPSGGQAARIFLTDAQLPPPGASLLRDQNLLPWLVR